MSDARTKTVAGARAWLGRKEADGSHKKIIDIYNSQPSFPRGYKVKYTDAWCAAFVSALGIKGGISHILLPECSVGEMAALYKNAGRFQKTGKYTPKAGDLVVYDWNGNGSGDHIGVVEWVYGKEMAVLEGNYQNAVARRKVKTDSKAILGYCTPAYPGAAEVIGSVKAVQSYLDAFCDNELLIDGKYGPKTKKALISALQTELGVKADGIFGPETEKAARKQVLGRGSVGAPVQVLQMFLICNGYAINADGIFGSKTEKALRTYQKKAGLTADGLAGKNTFKKLCSG